MCCRAKGFAQARNGQTMLGASKDRVTCANLVHECRSVLQRIYWLVTSRAILGQRLMIEFIEWVRPRECSRRYPPVDSDRDTCGSRAKLRGRVACQNDLRSPGRRFGLLFCSRIATREESGCPLSPIPHLSAEVRQADSSCRHAEQRECRQLSALHQTYRWPPGRVRSQLDI